MTTELKYKEPLTLEEDTEWRLSGLVTQDYGVRRAVKSQGAHLSSRGGHNDVVLNPEVIGLEPPPIDDEHRELKLPRVLRRGIYLPMDDRTLTPLEVFDKWMKTPAKRRKFVLACTREPTLPVFTGIKAGTEFSRLGIATAHTAKLAEEMALDKVGAQPGEKCLAVRIECRDRALAMELIQTKGDALPWGEVTLDQDGGLPVGWHGCRLTREEQDRLKEQADRDRRAKRDRRDRVIRSMQREPL